MTDAVLAALAALGTAVSLWGTLRAMGATPIVGDDVNGYLTLDVSREIKNLIASQRRAWTFLRVGFCLQFVSALGLALLAFAHSYAERSLAGRVINGTSVILRDHQGRPRIQLSAVGSRPFLRFLDTTGATNISLEIDSTIAEPVLSMYAGRDRSITGRFAADAMGASVTTLLDGRLQGSITALSVSPVILFTSPDRGARLEFKEPRPTFAFVDADGNVTGTLARARP
jgi:hypothetical protein